MNTPDQQTIIALAIDSARAGIIRDTRHDHTERSHQLEASRRIAVTIADAMCLGDARVVLPPLTHDERKAYFHNALHGPAVARALNDEALARYVGPGTPLDHRALD